MNEVYNIIKCYAPPILSNLFAFRENSNNIKNFQIFNENEKVVKWLQRDSNPQPLSLLKNTQPFGQSSQMNELCCEYLSV